MRIIYIISMPRSGSTLLQKLLLTGKGFGTLPETWYLLSKSIVNVSRNGLVETGFRAHRNATASFYSYLGISFSEDFSYTVDSYRKLISTKKSDHFDSFVEKTPRNLLIVNEIYENLQDGDKIVILRRELPEVLGSYLQYFDTAPFVKSYKFYREISQYNDILNKFLSRDDIDQDKVMQLEYSSLLSHPDEASIELGSFLNTSLNPYNLGNMSPKKGVRFHGDKKQLESREIIRHKQYRSVLLKKIVDFYYDRNVKSWLLFPLIILSFTVYRINPRVFSVLKHKNSFVH